MQIADKYPSAEVIGMDISPVQPQWVPPNLNYEVDDLEQEWLYKSDLFDLIYVRFMFMAIRDWPAMLEQAYRCVRPGGYVELAELRLDPVSADPSRPSAPTVREWNRIQGGILRSKGIDMTIALKFKQMLIEAGFEDVREEVMELPWGAWHPDPKLKAIGFWHLEQLKQGLQGIVMASMTRAGWTSEQVEIFLAKLRRELDDPENHTVDHAYVRRVRSHLLKAANECVKVRCLWTEAVALIRKSSISASLANPPHNRQTCHQVITKHLRPSR